MTNDQYPIPCFAIFPRSKKEYKIYKPLPYRARNKQYSQVKPNWQSCDEAFHHIRSDARLPSDTVTKGRGAQPPLIHACASGPAFAS